MTEEKRPKKDKKEDSPLGERKEVRRQALGVYTHTHTKKMVCTHSVYLLYQ